MSVEAVGPRRSLTDLPEATWRATYDASSLTNFPFLCLLENSLLPLTLLAPSRDGIDGGEPDIFSFSFLLADEDAISTSRNRLLSGFKYLNPP